MTPAAAIARARALLLDEGFLEIGQGMRGESFYFGLPGAEGQLRVANHARTPKQRLKHPEVLASLVLAGPLSETALRERLDATLRDFRARRGRPTMAITPP
ncbi:hypothetical protein SAMN04487843_13346 [Methylobacterium sp. ap11]|uniref:hypothetical protein n=1 Tax=Methylobacterium sp. ap11 TaxID=1761799 RepID=UPI0008BDA581|nr:hypothetical protein [Methylobacterium sp. ap11]SEP49988.1 hypothetical protein SAMN04487843_13346 [Methylobacterium sp. ap11]